MFQRYKNALNLRNIRNKVLCVSSVGIPNHLLVSKSIWWCKVLNLKNYISRSISLILNYELRIISKNGLKIFTNMTRLICFYTWTSVSYFVYSLSYNVNINISFQKLETNLLRQFQSERKQLTCNNWCLCPSQKNFSSKYACILYFTPCHKIRQIKFPRHIF